MEPQRESSWWESSWDSMGVSFLSKDFFFSSIIIIIGALIDVDFHKQIYNMKIKVNFDSMFGIKPYEINLPNHETVESLQIHLSLNFQAMDSCVIKHNGKVLKNKKEKLNQIFHEPSVEVEVVKMNEYEEYQNDLGRSWTKTKTMVQKNEKAVGVLLGVLIILFLISIG